MKRLVAAVVVVTMVGCGGTDTTRSLERDLEAPGDVNAPTAPAQPGTPDDARDEGPTMQAMLRLRGVDLGAYTTLLGQVRAVEVEADGVRRDVRLEGKVFDLARSEHAWKLATFSIPEDAENVSVTLRFDNFGGWETADAAGFVDLRFAPVRFSAPAAWFSEHGHAVVDMELTRSLRDVGLGRLLMPSFQVRY